MKKNSPVIHLICILQLPARITAFQNGVLIQNNSTLIGLTNYIGQPAYKANKASCIKLQDHGDPGQPISFTNIWIREL